LERPGSVEVRPADGDVVLDLGARPGCRCVDVRQHRVFVGVLAIENFQKLFELELGAASRDREP
jgi:hypothetical protein